MSDITPEPFKFSAPVVLIKNFKPRIRDLKLFAQLPMLESSPDLAASVIPDVISLLDRAVVGGVLDRDAAELWPLVEEVSKQLQAGADNPNSKASS